MLKAWTLTSVVFVRTAEQFSSILIRNFFLLGLTLRVNTWSWNWTPKIYINFYPRAKSTLSKRMYMSSTVTCTGERRCFKPIHLASVSLPNVDVDYIATASNNFVLLKTKW